MEKYFCLVRIELAKLRHSPQTLLTFLGKMVFQLSYDAFDVVCFHLFGLIQNLYVWFDFNPIQLRIIQWLNQNEKQSFINRQQLNNCSVSDLTTNILWICQHSIYLWTLYQQMIRLSNNWVTDTKFGPCDGERQSQLTNGAK